MEFDNMSAYLVAAAMLQAVKTLYVIGPAPRSSKSGSVIESGPDGRRFVDNNIFPIYALPLGFDMVYTVALAIQAARRIGNAHKLEDSL